MSPSADNRTSLNCGFVQRRLMALEGHCHRAAARMPRGTGMVDPNPIAEPRCASAPSSNRDGPPGLQYDKPCFRSLFTAPCCSGPWRCQGTQSALCRSNPPYRSTSPSPPLQGELLPRSRCGGFTVPLCQQFRLPRSSRFHYCATCPSAPVIAGIPGRSRDRARET